MRIRCMLAAFAFLLVDSCGNEESNVDGAEPVSEWVPAGPRPEWMGEPERIDHPPKFVMEKKDFVVHLGEKLVFDFSATSESKHILICVPVDPPEGFRVLMRGMNQSKREYRLFWRPQSWQKGYHEIELMIGAGAGLVTRQTITILVSE